MKKLNLLFLLFVGILGMSALSSCTPEENTDVLPSMTFSTDGAAIAANATVAIDAPLLFKISSIENPNTKKNLQSLRVQSFTNNTAVKDTTITINSTSHLVSLNYNAVNTYSTEEKFTFTLTDKAGETATKTITITTEAAPAVGGSITSFSAVLLGAQSNSTYGSYLDAHTGTVYLQSQSISNAAAIDMIYYYGSSNAATIVAPSDATVNGGAGNLSMAVGMSPQNATQFNATSVTASDFDAISDDLAFPSSVSGGTIANMLTAGSVVEFETADGKIGMFKVVSISSMTATSEMTIDVKIQD